MNRKSPLFDSIDPAREAEADQRADADVEAGRLIDHGVVRRWLSDWSRGKASSRPKVGD